MAYGFQQLDSAGNVVVDSSAPVQTIMLIEAGLSITLYPSGYGTNTYDYSLTGVTSQTDLDDNYVLSRTDAGGWNAFSEQNTHSVTYVSAGTIRFQWAGTCQTIFGDPRACTSSDAVTNTFDIHAIGKTL
jgi:hypothetical protein